MAQGNLEFLEGMSVEDFKKSIGVSTIDIVRNPKTNKLFFDASMVSGAVAKEIDWDKDLKISKVRPEGGGEEFYMLHNKPNSDNIDRVI